MDNVTFRKRIEEICFDYNYRYIGDGCRYRITYCFEKNEQRAFVEWDVDNYKHETTLITSDGEVKIVSGSGELVDLGDEYQNIYYTI